MIDALIQGRPYCSSKRGQGKSGPYTTAKVKAPGGEPKVGKISDPETARFLMRRKHRHFSNSNGNQNACKASTGAALSLLWMLRVVWFA